MIGGFFGGHEYVVINRKGDTGAIFASQASRPGTDSRFWMGRYSTAQWNRLLNKLFNKFRVQDWEHKYNNYNILDGTQWELSFRLPSGEIYDICGSNEYPDGFDTLYRMFRYYTHKRVDCDRKEIMIFKELFTEDLDVMSILENSAEP